jgi:hypothetical protein
MPNHSAVRPTRMGRQAFRRTAVSMTNCSWPPNDVVSPIDWDRGYWIAPRSLRDPDHPLHPRQTGETPSRAFILEDLICMARWKTDRNGIPPGCCEASLRFLANCYGCSKSHIGRVLQELEDAGFIRRRQERDRRIRRIS